MAVQTKSTPIWVPQIEQWLERLTSPFNAVDFYKPEYEYDEKDGSIVVFHARLYTHANMYHIRATESRVGCEVVSRKWDVGEDWHRGRDCGDGDISNETLDFIQKRILQHEILKVPPPVIPQSITGA